MENNVKQKELEIFKQFAAVCEELNIKYYLIAGSLIGCIRHHGFIPWDDDIDVAMPRKDYELFLKEGQKMLPKNLFLQSSSSDKNFFLSYCKLRDTTTIFLEKNSSNLNINHGIFIDIFPLDNFKKTKFFLFRMSLLRKIIFFLRSLFFNTEKSKKFMRKTLKNILLFLRLTPDKINRFYEKKIKKIKPNNYCNNYSSNYQFKEACPWEWFGDGQIRKFENLSVIVPEKFDEYLTQIYGNYLELPPVEKRISNHQTITTNFDN